MINLVELIRRYSKQDGTRYELERLLRVLERAPDR